jgi:hypothetical protein
MAPHGALDKVTIHAERNTLSMVLLIVLWDRERLSLGPVHTGARRGRNSLTKGEPTEEGIAGDETVLAAC